MDQPADSPRPLAEMLGDVPPEHDLRGRMIVLVIYGLGAAAWATLVLEMNDGWGVRLGAFIVGAVIFAPFAYIARAVQRFASWSWAFVGGWLLLFFLIAVTFIFDRYGSTAERGGAVATAMTFLGGLHYLWLRRWDFWADERLERLRTRRRYVTREWRAARLTQIRTAHRPRAASPRPGALWMRHARTARG